MLHGTRSLVLQQEDGVPAAVPSVASGLVYPRIGPEMAMLHESCRLTVATIPNQEIVSTFYRMAKYEGITPA